MGPLTGVKVVELASLAPAPFGSMILADFGADVLRVDRVGNGDGLTPPAGPLDRGKHTIALNLKDPEDLARLQVLIANADVFIEGFRPGVAERLGIGPGDLEAHNPTLIYGRMTGWGQDGPLANAAGHDINYIALSGVLDLVGREGGRPVPPGNIVGDFAGGGMLLALGVVAALYERERSGKGQVIDAAMVDGLRCSPPSYTGCTPMGCGTPRVAGTPSTVVHRSTTRTNAPTVFTSRSVVSSIRSTFNCLPLSVSTIRNCRSRWTRTAGHSSKGSSARSSRSTRVRTGPTCLRTPMLV
ncbi:hypothetical protein GCM10020255_086330 [Rhodococcus baikonurensis]